MVLFIHSILDQNNNGQKTGGHHQASKRPTNQKKKQTEKKAKIISNIDIQKRKEKNRLHSFSSSISLCEKYCEVKQHDDGHGETKKKNDDDKNHIVYIVYK